MIDLYTYCKNYLQLQTFLYFPFYKINIENYFQPELYSGCWSHAAPGSETRSDVMRMLAMVLQNRQRLPNVIGFIKHLNTFENVLHDFDVDYISKLTPDQLLKEFEKTGVVISANKSWMDYCIGVIDASHYLKNNFTTFPQYKEFAQTHLSETINGLCSIKGIGQALARNFLKEIGVDTCKPDVHLKEIFAACENTTPDHISNNRCVELLHQKALAAGVSDYQFDKVLWLICSGYYYQNNLRISKGKKDLKKRFINALVDDITTKVVDY